jgi:hypothetical protein
VTRDMTTWDTTNSGFLYHRPDLSCSESPLVYTRKKCEDPLAYSDTRSTQFRNGQVKSNESRNRTIQTYGKWKSEADFHNSTSARITTPGIVEIGTRSEILASSPL